jgi:cell division protein FtsL
METLLNKVSYTTIIVVHLFICGTLYIIGYWSTFDFDITNYIEIFDIPKSFVFPLAISIGTSVLSIMIQAIAFTINKKGNENVAKKPSKFKKTLLYDLLSNAGLMAMISLFVCILIYKPQREIFYALTGCTFIFYLVSTVPKSNLFFNIAPSPRARLFLTLLILCFRFFVI